MNRDEKLDRFTALPPKIVDLAGRRSIFPWEPKGGTWISMNDAGICLSLINWHRIKREPKHDVVSRGQIVRELAGKSSAAEIAKGVMKTAAAKIAPFSVNCDRAFGKTCNRMALEPRVVDHAKSPMATPTLVFVRF